MVNITARYRAKGKNFEVLVNADKASQFKKGLSTIENVLATDQIFYDIKKGLKASTSDLKDCFGTDNSRDVAERIVKNGEVELPLELKRQEQENRIKQVVAFFVKNAVDTRTGLPFTEKRIEEAMGQAGISVENKPINQQVNSIASKLKTILPLKIATKKLKITIPAVHAGKVYGLLNEYKEKESWLDNGDLVCVVNIPSGLQMEFYDKLNGVTHGSSIAEEIKE
ncbi:MAG: ribosome assembly factor SBDS [Candidatus Pacearchaeota archaeon]|nr:ribosome assembly factor SBDS [Candidatus Pacearchaeota archaeon]